MTRFRGTFWPGIALPMPDVYRPAPSIAARSDVVLWRHPVVPWRQLAEDVVLRELSELDTRSDISLLMFLAEHGWIDAQRNRARRESLDSAGRQWIGQITGDLLDHQDFAFAEEEAIMLATVFDDDVASAVTIGEARREIRLVQVCARWELTGEGITEAGFAWLMTQGLQRFHPRLSVKSDPAGNPWPGAWGPDYCDVIDALYLQLSNLITEGAEYKVCIHCASPFTRQRGRAQRGQYRVAGGVVYCSSSCANAASTKAYRQRIREQRP